MIAFDRPGLGWTERLPTGRTESIAEQAELLQRAAAQLGAERPIVLGQSYGGAVALAWAVETPEALSALVLVSAVSQPWEGGLSAFYKVTSSRLGQLLAVPLISALVSDERIDASLVEVFGPQAVPEGYRAAIGSGLTLRRGSLRANADQRASLKAEIIGLQPRYSEIRVPTEIIHGTADTTVGFEIHSAASGPPNPGCPADRAQRHRPYAASCRAGRRSCRHRKRR